GVIEHHQASLGNNYSGSVVTGNRNNTYSYNWSYYDYQTNADRNDTFTFSCNVYYLVGSANSSNQETYWENNNFYEQAWDDQGYNNTIRDMLHTIAGEEDLRFVCDESFNGYWENDQYYYVSIYQITISDGFGFRCYSMDGAPIVYWRDSENNNSWDGGYGASVYYDGVELGCGAPILGGNGEIIIDLYYWINEPFFDKEHRVLFAYELIPVIPLE
ncbi:MAG: hypothetical protein P8Q35_04090, partial [Candidatus Thalassarchaeaceae archaeon]|nr:hypothetical protein [Candidatus Thalassarchaeaceae archaeon]